MKRFAILLVLFFLPACGNLTCDQKRHRAIKYMNDGVQNFQQGLHGAALRNLRAAVKEDDNFAQAHYQLVKVYQKMGKWDDAQRHMNRVIDLEPNEPRNYYDLGFSYQRLHRLDLAAKAYDKALSLNDKLYKVHYRKGTVFLVQDKPKEADAAFRKAVALNPRFTKAFVKLGMLYLDYDYPDLALQVLKTGVTINPTSGEAHNILGVAYQVTGKLKDAIKSFEEAIGHKRDLYGAYYNLGMTSAEVGDKKKAEKALTHFTNVGAGKSGVDPAYVSAAHEKLAEMMGGGGMGGQAAPPKRLH